MTYSNFVSPGVSLQGGGGSGGGGGGTPGGSNTQLQYNSSGSFAGAAGLTTDGTSLTITGGNLTMSGNISAPAWTTSGIRWKSVASTLTDTTSTGTVAAAYTNVYGGNTIAATNSTTFTDYFTSFINGATAGTNVTFTNNWALGLNGAMRASGQSLTGSQAQSLVDLAATWNTTGTPTGLKLNVTDTASASGSLLMDLQVNTASRFNVSKAGRISGATGVYAPYVDLGGPTNGPVQIGRVDNGNILGIGYGNTGVLTLRSDAAFGWSNSSTVTGSSLDPATVLTRRAAANLRLGAADTSASATITVTIAAPGVVTWSDHSLSTGSPVIFTTTGALPTGITANTTYYAIVVSANTFQLASSFANALAGTAITTSGSQSGTHTGRRGAIAQQFGPQDTLSTGSLENIDGADFVIRGSRSIGNKPGGSIIFQVAPAGSSGTAQNALATAWSISGAGHFLAGADNAYDIGASGANRPRGIYTGGTIVSGGDVALANSVLFGGVGATKGQLFAISNGVFGLYDSSSTSFGRLCFGGSTSSFPAIKRSSTTLQARLADDSGFASVQGKLTTDTAYTAGDPTTTGYLVVFDSAGTAYKIPAVAV